MTWFLTSDPFWETLAWERGTIYSDSDGSFFEVMYSPRCGGKYSILHSLGLEVKNFIRVSSDREKARLVSFLIKERQQGNEQPRITSSEIDHVKAMKDMSVSDRADSMLKYIASKTPELGQLIAYQLPPMIRKIEEALRTSSCDPERLPQSYINFYNLIAFSESINYDGVDFLLEHLKENKWIEIENSNHNESEDVGMLDQDTQRFYNLSRYYCKLTVKGHIRLEEIQKIESGNL